MSDAGSAGSDPTTDPESPEAGFAPLPDGRRIAFEVRGQRHGGTPALLLRPLGGSIALWGPFRDVLTERMRVIAFDPCGAGESSPEPLGATTRDMARDAVLVLDHLGVPRAHVFGISLGGMVATWLAVDAPERVARLCIASAGPVGLDPAHLNLRRGVAMAACLLEPEGDVEACLTREVLSRDVRKEEPERVGAIMDTVAAEPAGRADILKHTLAAAGHDARAELHRIRAPTLVLAGDHDELIGSEPTAELAQAIPGARLEVIPDAGHDLTLEQPVATAERVAAFFLAPTGDRHSVDFQE
jgi:3-oxoadipate enol-lactonase